MTQQEMFIGGAEIFNIIFIQINVILSTEYLH